MRWRRRRQPPAPPTRAPTPTPAPQPTPTPDPNCTQGLCEEPTTNTNPVVRAQLRLYQLFDAEDNWVQPTPNPEQQVVKEPSPSATPSASTWWVGTPKTRPLGKQQIEFLYSNDSMVQISIQSDFQRKLKVLKPGSFTVHAIFDGVGSNDLRFTFVVKSGPRASPPGGRPRVSRVARSGTLEIVAAHPNVSSLDLAQVQRGVERILDRVALAIRFMALFSLAAGRRCSRARWRRANNNVRAMGRSCGRWGRRATSSSESSSPSTRCWGPRRCRGARPLDAHRMGPRPLRLRGSVRLPGNGAGLLGSTEVWRRPRLQVLRAE